VQANINRSNTNAGFTIPMLMWKQALGPEQFAVLAECLQVCGELAHDKLYPPATVRMPWSEKGSMLWACKSDGHLALGVV
jgi:hypothetical protein